MRLPIAVPPVVGYAALYAVAVLAGTGSTLGDDPGAQMIWPAAGVAAMWLVMSRDSPWRWAETGGIGVLTVAMLAAGGTDPVAAVVEGLAAMLGAIVFAFAAARWLPGLEPPAKSENLLGVWWLMVCGVLAALAATVLRTVGDLAVVEDWTFSVTGAAALVVRDTVSIVVFGAITRLVAGLLTGQAPPAREKATLRKLESAGVFAASALAYWAVFSTTRAALPIGFVLIPLTVWAAVRMPTPMVILHAAVFNSTALLYTVGEHGPYAVVGDVDLRALLIQVYSGILASVGLVLAISRDERETLIHRLKDSEEEATDKATMMTTVFNSMTEGLAILDHTGRFVLRNPAAGRLLGSASAVTGEVALGSDHGFFRPDGSELSDRELPHVRALAGEDVEPMDVLVRNAAVPEGRIVRFNVARLALGTGPYHVVVVFHDVTADRRHRDELMSFSGRVAHDLLNPLTTIEGWAEVLEQELAGYAPAEKVARIQRAAARMRTFLNGLLAYTAARDGKLMPTTVNTALLIGDIVNSRLDAAEADSEPPPYFEVGRLDPVEADPVLLRQLLENLIDNSLRTMAPGVSPYLAVSCQQIPNGMVRLDILDNGAGIPPGMAREVFTSFHREKGGTANGLELAICKRIVERHGGMIEAAPNPYGQGTRMSFTLPAGRSAYAKALTPTR